MKRVLIVLLGIAMLIPASLSLAGVCGDVNDDGLVNVLDIIYLIDYKFRGGAEPNCPEGTVTDIDGNEYKTLTIGSQVWMAENLKVTHYRNGDPIPYVIDNGTWEGLSTGAYCNYDNLECQSAVYGRLYNWFAVADNRNIAPVGWHVPNDTEWQTIVDYLGGDAVAGGKMKEAGTTHWNSPNTGATNESGFTALPGGYRGIDGTYFNLGNNGTYWSSTENNTNFAWYRRLYHNNSVVERITYHKRLGFSVRCVKD